MLMCLPVHERWELRGAADHFGRVQVAPEVEQAGKLYLSDFGSDFF